jgi:hypothetical protein
MLLPSAPTVSFDQDFRRGGELCGEEGLGLQEDDVGVPCLDPHLGPGALEDGLLAPLGRLVTAASSKAQPLGLAFLGQRTVSPG